MKLRPLLLVLLALLPSPVLAQALDAQTIDPSQISVSGLSSGAFMAGQVHVAFSKTIMGAGIIAGGPFDCARASFLDSMTTATHICTRTFPPSLGTPNIDKIVALTRAAAKAGTIDDTANLSRARVYLFSGQNDETVPPPVMDSVHGFYKAFSTDAVRAVTDRPVVHALVTDDYGLSCDELAKKPAAERGPYLCNGGYDTAGALLTQIYGPLKPRVAPVPANLRTFSQGEFTHGEQDSLHPQGHVYVPSACADGKPACKLHIALHGCLQNQDTAADAFYAHAGYNSWAEANAIIVLYPQVLARSGNPNGCWDFWGYSGTGFDHRNGPQLSAIAAMINKLAGTPLIGDTAAGP
jgi:poly(3-hydroxybutyrate) depolymerase